MGKRILATLARCIGSSQAQTTRTRRFNPEGVLGRLRSVFGPIWQTAWVMMEARGFECAKQAAEAAVQSFGLPDKWCLPPEIRIVPGCRRIVVVVSSSSLVKDTITHVARVNPRGQSLTPLPDASTANLGTEQGGSSGKEQKKKFFFHHTHFTALFRYFIRMNSNFGGQLPW